MSAITIVIADSTDTCRDALEGFLHENPSDYQLLDTACSGQELIQKAQQHQPNIIITAVDLPDISGTEICHKVLQLCSNTQVIARTTDDIAYHARRMLKAGARGMLLKHACKAEIRQCINWVHQGNFHLGSECSHLQSRKFREEKELNGFEQQVLPMICQWKGTEQIAKELFSSFSKVKRARERINRLAGTINPYGIIRWAWREGYISLRECWGK